VHALIACEYAGMLSESDGTEDRRRALALAEDAGATADELGMRALKSEANELQVRLQGAAEEHSPPPANTNNFTISQLGDSWLVRYGNVEFHLKDMRGVRLLAALVAEPGREFHVLDLTGGSRVNVQRRIRDAIRRIESHHPELGKHLERSVRTGTYCAYEP
jgi:hypothetical protein